MKKIILLTLLLITSLLFSDEVQVNVYEKTYYIDVPETEEELKTLFLETVIMYLEESLDFEELLDIHENYRESSEDLIESKDKVIADKDNEIIDKDVLIASQDLHIKQLSKFFYIIPTIDIVFKETISGGGLGVGFLLGDLFLQTQVQFPLQISLNAGWRF